MAINTELLTKIRDHILEKPRRYDQSTFCDRVSLNQSPCGTRACIAGWAAFLSGRVPLERLSVISGIHKIAQEELGLSELQAINLFSWRWPEPYNSDYDAAELSFTARAKVAAELLDKVIETDGEIINEEEEEEWT